VKGLILVRGARQLLTLHGPKVPRRGAALRDLGLIHDGSVLIRDGVIEEVGPSRRVENLSVARAAVEIDATGRVVMPGFVDAQSHLAYGVPWLKDFEMRIAGSDALDAATGYLASSQWLRKSSLKTMELRVRRSLNTFIRHGTTTIGSSSGFSSDSGNELKVLRLLARLNQQPLDVVPSLLAAFPGGVLRAKESSAYVDRLCEDILPAVRQRRLAGMADVVCGPGGFSLHDAVRLFQAAVKLGFRLRVEADQFERSGAVPLAVEAKAMAVSHLEHSSAEDLALLCASDTIATLCPGPAFHLGTNRFVQARALIDGGAAVALATNFNPHTSPTCNMQMILSLACSQLGMMPGEAISAATINGAHSLGCAGRVGSLEHGKSADLLLLNVSDYREMPYYFGVNSVHLTIKRGVVLYQEGRVESLPQEN
jgi:imidazolonepropionase